MVLHHSSRPRSLIPHHSRLSSPINCPACQRSDSTVPRCGPVIAQRLQQLYNDVLRHFDQVYISDIVAQLRNSQASGQLRSQPPRPQAQPHQPTEAGYHALLASITETVSILPRFSHTSGAELRAHHVPQHIITFVEQNREHLRRAAQDLSGLRAGLTSTRTQVNHTPALQTSTRRQQFIPGHRQPQQLQRQGLVQGPGRPNTLQSAQSLSSERASGLAIERTKRWTHPACSRWVLRFLVLTQVAGCRTREVPCLFR
jgi:hypothetical protein